MLQTVLLTAWIELPAWMLLAFGFYLALRVLRFPDLTVEAAFIAGGVGAAWGATELNSAIAGLGMAVLLGGSAGLMTGGLYAIHQTPLFKLLSGLLILFGFYSINYRVLGLRSDVGFSRDQTIFNILMDYEARVGLNAFRPYSTGGLYAIVAIVVILCLLYLRTESGLMFRALGYRPEIMMNCGRSPIAWLVAGLIGVNVLASIGGWVYATINGNVNITEFGYVLHALAAVILGELLLKLVAVRFNKSAQLRLVFLAPFVGAIVYTLIRAVVMYLVSNKVGVGGDEVWLPIKQDLNLLFGILLALLLLAMRVLSLQGEKLSVTEVDEL